MRTALTVRGADGEERTYEADTEDLCMGVCEDALRMTKVDLLLSGDPSAESEGAMAFVQAFADFYPTARQVFPGLTEEEYRTARPREVVEVMRAIVQHTMEVLQGVQAEGGGKNPQGRRSPSTRRSSTSKSR